MIFRARCIRRQVRSFAPSTFRFVIAIAVATGCGGRVNVGSEAGPVGGNSGANAVDASRGGDERAGNGGAGSNAGGAGGSAGSGGGAAAMGGAAGMGGAGANAGAAPTGGRAGTTVGAGGAMGGAAGAGRAGASGGLSDASDAPDIAASPDAPRDRRIPDGCTPLTCSPVGGTYCGLICDGCGNELDCGSCSAGQSCGPRVPNFCGAPCPLCSQIPKCESGRTTVRGTVITGAAINPDPVYGATVFIPNLPPGDKLPPLPAGPSCSQCTPLTGDATVTAAISGPDGAFSLYDVPAGTGIPLVVQLGRWRYETTIDVTPCTDNPLPLGKARLPRTQWEGNIPLTAIATGNLDALECVLRKMGVADTEFSNPTGAGRIQLYRNNGAVYDAATPNQAVLVDAPAAWDKYDQILFACEGIQTDETAPALQNFINYTNKGGRVLATHFSYTWLYQNGAFATAGAWQVNQPPPPSPLIANIDTTTQRGQDFATWLGLVGALSTSTPPQIAIGDPRHDLNAVPAGLGGQRWIYSDSPSNVQEMVVTTPVGASPDQSCGRVIYTDFHVANAANGALTFPAECTGNDLTPQEKLLEFALLHLGSCPGFNGTPPPVPPPPPPPTTPPCN
jgi:hypothetical protein